MIVDHLRSQRQDSLSSTDHVELNKRENQTIRIPVLQTKGPMNAVRLSEAMARHKIPRTEAEATARFNRASTDAARNEVLRLNRLAGGVEKEIEEVVLQFQSALRQPETSTGVDETLAL